MLASGALAAEEFSHDGSVVEYGSDTTIENIKIDVKKGGKIITTKTTDDAGAYSFTLDKEITGFTLRFKDTRNPPEYSAQAQFGVQNDANPNSLDSQGLVSTEQAGQDEVAAARAHEGNRRYEASASNDKERVEADQFISAFYTEAAKHGTAFRHVPDVLLDERTRDWVRERGLTR